MSRIKETLKSFLIAVLLLSALGLMLLALPASVVSDLPLPDALADTLGITPEELPVAVPGRFSTAASPTLISICRSGGRHTVTRDAKALSSAYDTLSVFLGQALASAENGEPITADDFTGCLDLPGVLFSFPGNIPAPALSQWLTGQSGAVSQSAGDYLLIREKNTVTLLLLSASPIKYETSVSVSDLLSALETFTPDGSSFALDRDTSLHPLTLWEQDVMLPNYAAESPVTGDFATELATALDFNPYGSGVYTDPEGNTIYSETDRTLTVSPGGAVTLTVTEPGLARYTARDDSPAAKIETARSLLDTITGDTMGEARMQLCSVRDETLSFTYLLNGTPVLPAACTVTFRGRDLTELSIWLRSYHISTGQSRLMPLTSALSIVEENTRLTPAYSLNAECGWARSIF